MIKKMLKYNNYEKLQITQTVIYKKISTNPVSFNLSKFFDIFLKMTADA